MTETNHFTVAYSCGCTRSSQARALRARTWFEMSYPLAQRRPPSTHTPAFDSTWVLLVLVHPFLKYLNNEQKHSSMRHWMSHDAGFDVRSRKIFSTRIKPLARAFYSFVPFPSRSTGIENEKRRGRRKWGWLVRRKELRWLWPTGASTSTIVVRLLEYLLAFPGRVWLWWNWISCYLPVLHLAFFST